MTRDKAIEFAEQQRPADRRRPRSRRTRSTRTCGAARSRPASSRTSGTARSRTSTPTRRTRRRRASADEVVITFERGRAGRDRRPPGHDAAGDRGAQPPRRRAGRRPARHGRGPARRHQEPRGLRGARRHRADHRPRRSSRTSRSSATWPASSAASTQRWGELVYDGLWFSPLKRALDAFVARTQKHVTGDIRMTLHGGPRRGHRPAQRRVAVRLQPRHLRRRATPSTSRWPRASSTCGACPARSRPSATSGWVATVADAGSPGGSRLVGRPVRGRAVRRAGRAVAVDALRLAAGAVRPRRSRRAHARVLHARRAAHRRRARRDARRRSTGSRRTSPSAPSCRTAADEDVHTALERGLIERLGPELGGKLRAGRSRNDQVATDFRLYLRDHAPDRRRRRASSCSDALLEQAAAPRRHRGAGLHPPAARAAGVVRPRAGQARPRRSLRDVERLRDWDRRTALSPMGAGALAGLVAAARPAGGRRRARLRRGAIANSIDAVSDRDFVAEFCFVTAMIGVHLSRLGEEICLWTSRGVRLGRRSTTPGRPGQLDHAAEEEPRRRRAGARQVRAAHRRPHRPARDAQGPAVRLQPRPAGGQGAGVRRGRHAAPACCRR